jgi:phosphotransferase system HPr (HPr) family protein
MKNIELTASSTDNNRRWLADRTLRQTFAVNLKHGLHARPCAQLVKALRPFRSQVEVQANGQQANGHSIMGLMALAAERDCRLTFTISGIDAPQAMTAVSQLFETDFGQQTYSAAV